MRTWQLNTFAAGILIATLLFPAMLTAGEPMEFVKRHAEEVANLLQMEESEQRTDELTEKLHQVFDFRRLASRSLGKHWEARSDEQKETFLDLLEELLRANYSKKLRGETLGEDYTIEYVEERTRNNRAIVTTKVVVKNKKPKPVEYKLMKGDGGWITYDIVIDDVSLEETYRDSYTAIIEDEGWDKLIERMRNKIEELKTEETDNSK